MTRRSASVWTTSACAATLLVALAGCGAHPQEGSQPASSAGSPTSSLTAAASASASASASQPAASPSASASSSPSAAASPSSSASAAPASSDDKIAKTYRMNKAYNIVPIDKNMSTDKVVLLTFDDGPKEEVTLAPLLDALDKHHAKAIFFVNGYRVKAHPELLKEIDKRGQVIGNHSYDHIMLGKEKEPKVRDQIERVQAIVKEVTGKTPVFFRPPFASANDAVRKVSKENGLLYMTWSNGSLDWDLGKKVKDKPQAVIDNVMKQLHPGANILMHELPWTAEAMDRLLTQLEAKGYSFVDPNAIEISLK